MASTPNHRDAMDVDSAPPFRTTPVKRGYSPNQYDSAPYLPLTEISKLHHWDKTTYSCLDSRGEGSKREYYMHLLHSDLEGWVSKDALPEKIRRVTAATASRIKQGWSAHNTPRDPASVDDQEAVPGAASAGESVGKRAGLRSAVALRLLHVKALKSSCNEKLFAGAQHAGKATPCVFAGYHAVEPHYHFRPSLGGEMPCVDDECGSFFDHRVCQACHDGVWEGVYLEEHRAEIVGALRRGVPVGAAPLCEECGHGKIEGRIADEGWGYWDGKGKWADCCCVDWDVSMWACGDCRVREMEYAKSCREREMAMRRGTGNEGSKEWLCACGEDAGKSARVWECLACGGVVIKAW